MGFINIFGTIETFVIPPVGGIGLAVEDDMTFMNFGEGALFALALGAIAIFGNLFGRLIEWAIMTNTENQTVKEAKRALKKFDSVIEKTSDAKLKAKYKAQREKIVKQIEKIDLEEY